MAEFIRCEREGRVLVITIDRPEVMNALSPQASSELSEVIDQYAADPELWVAIVTGAGTRAFCAGHDLKFQAASGGRQGEPATGFGGLALRFDLDKPLIAAVNGLALGGGFTIALACDLIVAAQGATFGFPEVRVGLAAVSNGVHRLPRAIGVKNAMGMVLTGRRVSAAEGMRVGFVNEVVADGEALEAARRWAAQILEASPMSVRASKQAMHGGLGRDLEGASRASYPAVRAMFDSEDAREGPKAFVEKRKPDWKGR